MRIRAVGQSERSAWERMREMLWPVQPGEHAGEIDRYFAGNLAEPVEVLLAFNERGEAIGFIELSIRAYAEGCSSDRVAFIEGCYVEPAERRRAWAPLSSAPRNPGPGRRAALTSHPTPRSTTMRA